MMMTAVAAKRTRRGCSCSSQYPSASNICVYEAVAHFQAHTFSRRQGNAPESYAPEVSETNAVNMTMCIGCDSLNTQHHDPRAFHGESRANLERLPFPAARVLIH